MQTPTVQEKLEVLNHALNLAHAQHSVKAAAASSPLSEETYLKDTAKNYKKLIRLLEDKSDSESAE